MRRRSLYGWCVALSALAFCGALRATHPEPADENLLCEVDGNTVKLSWNIVFIAPIDGWIISRDGTDIARLPPDASGYADENVAEGEHLYGLAAINFTGDVFSLGRCIVAVGDFGLRCRTSGLQVHLEWGPILIDIFISHFIIRRDGAVIASVPPDVLEYTDTVAGPSTYRYTVHAESSPGHGFLIGACTARVPGTGFICDVQPPDVLIDWSRVPLPAVVIDYFAVVRDGAIIARTRETHYTDQPPPGEHLYRVYAIFGLGSEPVNSVDSMDQIDKANRFLVGECKIVMPGSDVPPPEELTCADLDAPSDIAAEIDFLQAHDVLLVWQKPVEYDWVLIARNFEFIARIPGSQFYYVDRDVPPGVYTYSVVGVLGGRVSPAAKCEVSIPRPPLPPPRDLRCEVLSITPSDPPELFVSLRWTNGAIYDRVIVARNGERIAALPGSATSYRDGDPRPGLNKYAVFGVVGLRRSDAAECEVEVPVESVPPPEDLVCAVIDPVPEPGPEPLDPDNIASNFGTDSVDGSIIPVPVPTVLLRWANPILYQSIVILRNNMQIATLPGDSQSFVDHPAILSATIVYSVIGVIRERRSPPATCEVHIGPPFLPPPQDFHCEVLGVAREPTTTQNQNAREPAIEPAIPVPTVRLTWVNPVHYLVLVFLRDDGGIARLPGSAMVYHDINPPAGHHVYTLWGINDDGNESPRVRCAVDVPPGVVPPVADLTCAAIQDSAGTAGVGVLRWVNPVNNYDAITILRGGEHLVTLPGDATSYFDRGLGAGVYEYAVHAVIGDQKSAPETCTIVIGGPQPRNLLFFSSGVFEPSSSAGELPVPMDGDGAITCLASNADPLQGWSFGVCSDPSVLFLADASIDDTVTARFNDGAGPDFLSIHRFKEGVTMAVVIDLEDPGDTLPPANAHKLFRLFYQAGPEGVPGGRYPVRYCGTLGEPPVSILFVVRGFEVVPDTLAGWVRLPSAFPLFLLRGDVNGDQEVHMSDAVSLLNWLFLGGRRPRCMEQADINGSSEINIADAVYELQWEFLGGPEPPPPFPSCGPGDPALGCETPTCPQPVN